MRHIRCLWLIALAACSVPPVSAERLSKAEPNQVARLTLDGDRVVTLAVPVDFRSLPALARTTCDAIAPEGRLLFCAREQGPRGDGFRVERGYSQPFDHYRSVLVDANGTVLERSHTLPLSKVPQHVLAAALTNGTSVDSAEIVSGPVREEYWHIIAKDRRGRVFVVRVDLEGNELSRFRRNQSRVDS